MGEDDHGVDGEAAEGAADGEAEVAKGGDLGEAAVEGGDAAAGVDEEHHAVVGKEADGGDEEDAHDPAGALEGVGEAEDAGANDGDEDVGEGLGIGGERFGFGEEERGVFSGE